MKKFGIIYITNKFEENSMKHFFIVPFSFALIVVACGDGSSSTGANGGDPQKEISSSSTCSANLDCGDSSMNTQGSSSSISSGKEKSSSSVKQSLEELLGPCEDRGKFEGYQGSDKEGNIYTCYRGEWQEGLLEIEGPEWNSNDPDESSSSVARSDVEESSDSQSSSSLAEGVVPHCRTESDDNCEYGTLVDDRDGQTYKTVKIGDQWWMVENLNYAYLQPTARWDSSSFCRDNLSENCREFGRFYMWSAAMDSVGLFSENGKGCGDKDRCEPTYPVRGVCPSGWHLPSKEEFKILRDGVGVMMEGGQFLRSTSGWNDERYGCFDSYGFNAFPTGHWDGYTLDPLNFYSSNDEASFWSSTQDDDIENLFAFSFHVFAANTLYLWAEAKSFGYPVRCVKDAE